MRRENALPCKTGLGVSDETYGQEPGEPYIGGEIQGKGDVPSLFAVQSSILLEAHRRIAPGLHLPSCTEERAIDHNNAAFVDDTDGHASATRNSETPIRDVVQKLQRSGQIWSELMDITGGSIALHKTFWRILAWEVANGNLRIVRATTERIVIEDGRGAFAVIGETSRHQTCPTKVWVSASARMAIKNICTRR